MSFEIGDKVRLVNLPAHPGLEGLTGTVRSTCDEIVDVELDRNQVVKRLKTDKLRKLITGSICELQGLVGAYKLNGQLCEVGEFDSELHRYNIRVKSVSKKIKPENLRMVGHFRASMVTKEEMKKMQAIDSREEKIAFMTKAGCVLPLVVSGRIMADWAALDDPELGRKLLKAKQVSIASVSSSSYISFSRNRVVGGDEEVLREFFSTQKLSDIYYVLPSRYAGETSELPSFVRSIECSLPLVALLVDGFELLVSRDDRLSSLRSGAQRLDVQLAAMAQRPVTVHGSNDDVVLSLPSRGRYDKDQGSLLKEYEAALGIKRNS